MLLTDIHEASFGANEKEPSRHCQNPALLLRGF